MRHLIGFILALVTAVALLVGGGWGLTRASALTARGTHLTATTGVLALAALVAVGLLIGIVLAVRAVSPLASGLPGLALLGWSALFALSAHRALGWFPHSSGAPWAGIRAMLGNGTFALLGAAMIVPVFLPSRWRRPGGIDSEDDEDDLLPTSTGLLS